MKKLKELHFIDIKPGKSGPMSNAIIWNPHLAIRWHHQQKTPGLTEASYNSLMEWALDIGAKDMTEPPAVVPPPQVVPPVPQVPTPPVPQAPPAHVPPPPSVNPAGEASDA